MAQLALGAAGAVVGFWVGGPLGASIGWSLGAAAGGALFPPKGPHSEGPRLNDLRTQVSTYGAPIPIIYGRCGAAGCYIWAADVVEQRVDTEVGGKGGPTATQTEYSYFASFAVSICEGPMASMSRIWVNGKLFYDVRDEGNADAMIASGNFAQYFTWYRGTETQDPDPTMEAALGVGNVPGYRGRCYIVFANLPLTLFGNLPIGALNFQFEVTREGPPTTGLREIDRGESSVSGNMIFPVLENVIRTRNAPYTSVYSMGGVFVANDSPSEVDTQWPSVAGVASDSTNGVMRAHDGSTVRASEATLGLQFGETAMRLYAEIDGEGGAQISAVSFFDPADFYVGCAPCADLRHVIVFVGSSSGVISEYRLLRWDGGEGWTSVQTGTAPTTVGIGIVGLQTQSGQAYAGAGILESNLEYLWIVGGAAADTVARLYQIDPVSLALSEIDDWTSSPPAGGDATTAIWADSNGIGYVLAGGEGAYIVLTRNDGDGDNTEDLAEVVEDICNRCGLTSGQLDVTDLAGQIVNGFSVNGVTAGRAALQHLQRAYWFDSAEIDAEIVFVPRGGATLLDIPADDLGADQNVGTDLVTSERLDDDQMPTLLNVAYMVAAADYQAGVQTSQRETIPFAQPTNVELPLVLTDLEAKQISDVLLYDAWIGRTKRRFSTTREYAELTPTDIVTITDDAATYTVRIEKVRAAGGRIDFECVDEEASLYLPNSEAGLVETNDPLVLVGPTRLVMMDIPLLLAADNNAGFYVAGCGYLDDWPGARVYSSVDGGATFVSVATLNVAATIGACADPLGDWTIANYQDSINTLDVSLLNGSLSSCTADEILEGRNICAVGTEADGWELLQFKTATLMTGDVWRLSELLRGRLGTEHKIGTHGENETFVLLEVGKVQRIALEVGNLNFERQYKAVTYGNNFAAVPSRGFTNTGIGLECYSPVNAEATGWGGDVVITWDRRGRINNGWFDNIDVPLSEESESYEIDIYDGADVVRTLTSTTDSVTYTAAQQSADFGSPLPSSLDIRIYQLSALVGRGFPCIATVS